MVFQPLRQFDGSEGNYAQYSGNLLRHGAWKPNLQDKYHVYNNNPVS